MKPVLLRMTVLATLVFLLWGGIAVFRNMGHRQPSSSPIRTDTLERSPVLQLSLPDLAQHIQRLDQWQGRILVVNFWASWCEPCKAEMPMLNLLQSQWPVEQVRFVGIGVDEPQALLAYLRNQPVNYPILVGDQGTLNLTVPYGNNQSGIPFTLVFAPDGQIILGKLGRVLEPELRNAILTASRARQN